MSHCAKCGASVEAPEIYELAGQPLCEDCYLEQRVRPTTCDPWAVYTARTWDETRFIQQQVFR